MPQIKDSRTYRRNTDSSSLHLIKQLFLLLMFYHTFQFTLKIIFPPAPSPPSRVAQFVVKKTNNCFGPLKISWNISKIVVWSLHYCHILTLGLACLKNKWVKTCISNTKFMRSFVLCYFMLLCKKRYRFFWKYAAHWLCLLQL
jgi:hypothetical protein